MKKIVFLIITGIGWCGCQKAPSPSITVSVLSDKTDSTLTRPNIQTIRGFLDAPMYKEGKRTFFYTTLTNTTVNERYSTKLDAASFWDNTLERKSKEEQFYTDIETLLTKEDQQTSYSGSSILLPLLEHLKTLKSDREGDTVVLLYSHLLEASELFNGYKESNLLLQHPERVANRLQKKLTLPENLTGIQLYVVYYPHDVVADRRFNAMWEVYRILFKDSGLELHTGLSNAVIFK